MTPETPKSAWDGIPLEELFLRALRKNIVNHPVVIRLREWFPDAWTRAQKMFTLEIEMEAKEQKNE